MDWLPCPDAPAYAVSSQGQVMRVAGGPGARVGNVLKPSVGHGGYLHVVMMADGKRCTRTIHRLVARAFLGGPPTPDHQVAHADGTRQNNAATNLRWATVEENSADRLGHGTLHVRSWNSKLSLADIQSIRELAAAGTSQRAIARQYGVQSAHISKVVRGLKWRQHLQAD